ncbi:MAG TPA: polysaccharide biosynthesis tyrosine autokinase [Dehalococcoidia bacterium]|nr:polysaccharide biosynthesis tyrosine autokinase [Dehalococcoidia bacterium]
MELKVYLDFLRRRWWLLILGPLITGIAAFYVTGQMQPVYKATATVLVNRTVTPGVIDYNDLLLSERLTNTYAQLIERPSVMDEVIRRLALPFDRGTLEAKVSVAPIKDTQLLNVSVTDGDPAIAARLANTVSQAFADDTASQLSSAGTVTIAKPADVPGGPISPNLFMNLVLAGMLGIVAAVALGALLDYLDDTVKTEEDIESIEGMPILGRISRFKAGTGPAFGDDQQAPVGEAYRQLRTNVHFTAMGEELKTIVVTSANPAEGKSTTASNLATVLAQAGDRVILVDTDLRRSSLRKTFATAGEPSVGLTGLLLSNTAEALPSLVPTQWPNLKLLPSGVLPPNPSELLTSARMQRVIQSLRKLADYVIFDTPPVLAVTDAIILAARTDGTIVVAEAEQTRMDALRHVSKLLNHANARVIGVVLNKAKVHQHDYYYYRIEETEDGAKGLKRLRLPFKRSAASNPKPKRLPITRLFRPGTNKRAEIAGDAMKTLLAQGALSDADNAALVEDVEKLTQAAREESIAAWWKAATESNGLGANETGGSPPAVDEAFEKSMDSLLARFDNTVGMLRSLKEPEKPDLAIDPQLAAVDEASSKPEANGKQAEAASKNGSNGSNGSSPETKNGTKESNGVTATRDAKSAT